jgi:hypothetical protein
MRAAFAQLFIAGLLTGCGGAELEEVEAETEAAITTTYGTDSLGDTCASGASLSGFGSDEINTGTDVDSWLFTADGAFHNFSVGVTGQFGGVPIDCYAYVRSASGTWSIVVKDSATGRDNCSLAWTSNSASTFCVKIFAINGWGGSSQQVITSLVSGQAPDVQDEL